MTSSRNVKAYLKASAEVAALSVALTDARARMTVAHGKLTGGQLGEAGRIKATNPYTAVVKVKASQFNPNPAQEG